MEKHTGGVLQAELTQMSENDLAQLDEYDPNNQPMFFLFSNNFSNQNYCSTYAYDALGTLNNGEKMQDAYYIINEYFKKVNNGEIDIDSTCINSDYCLSKVNIREYGLTDDELRKVFISIRADHPEYFWLKNTMSFGYVPGDSTKKIMYFVPKVLPQYKTKNQRSDMKEKIDNAVDTFLNDINGESDFEKELQIHDKIIRETVYDCNVGGGNTNDSDDSINDHNIVGVLIDHVAVCESYAKTMQLLLNACGIENVYVVGLGNGGGHAWNQVCIDNKYYNVDCTWDDQPSFPGGITYQYFNVSDSEFGNHVAFNPGSDEYQYNVKTCDSSDKSYYNMKTDVVLNLDGVSEENQDDTIKAYIINKVKESLENNIFKVKMAGKDLNTAEKIRNYLNNNIGDIVYDDSIFELWSEKCNGVCGISSLSKDVVLLLDQKTTVTENISIPSSITFDRLYNSKYIIPNINPSYTTDTVSWSSSDSSVAVVKDGEIIPVGNGEADIIVTCGDKSATCHVEVKVNDISDDTLKKEIDVTGIEITPQGGIIYESGINSTIQFTAKLTPDNASNRNIYWYSSDSSIVSIEQNGVATAHKPGTAIIYACPEGAPAGFQYGGCYVTVKEVTKVSSIKISGESQISNKGGSLSLTAEVTPSNATYKDVTWSIVSGNDLADIEPSTGVLIAKGTANGTVTVKAEANDGSGVSETKTIELRNQVDVVNKVELISVYDANKDKTQGNYTNASWNAFTTALTNANTVINNANATQSEVDEALANLNSAISGLTENAPVVNKVELISVYDANKDKTQGNYTNASWNAFTEALSAAEVIINKTDAEQDEVNKAKNRFTKCN